MFVSEAKPKKMRQSSKTIEAREPSEASEINESENPGNNIIDAAVIELRNYMESVRDIMCNACLAIISEIPVSTELLSRIDDNTPQKTTEERILIEVIGLLNHISSTIYSNAEIPEDEYETVCSDYAYGRIFVAMEQQNENDNSAILPALQKVTDESNRNEVLRRYTEHLAEGGGREDLRCVKQT